MLIQSQPMEGWTRGNVCLGGAEGPALPKISRVQFPHTDIPAVSCGGNQTTIDGGGERAAGHGKTEKRPRICLGYWGRGATTWLFCSVDHMTFMRKIKLWTEERAHEILDDCNDATWHPRGWKRDGDTPARLCAPRAAWG